MKRYLVLLLLSAAMAASAKTGRTYYSAEMIEKARAKVEKTDWGRGALEKLHKKSDWLVEMSDEELWNFVPPPEQLRALNVSFGVGCPDCGKEIFRSGGHYPWIMTHDAPFKVQCPLCKKKFPENDFEPWNENSLADKPLSGKKRIDHGAGWLSEDGVRYYFVGTYVFWHRWQRQVLPGIYTLSKLYLLTGKPEYAHKCAVLLSRVARDYPQFDYRVQSYHNGKWPARINGRILDYIWTNETTGESSKAYDAIYPIFVEDKELMAFLAQKGVPDPRRTIEKAMLCTMIDDLKTGFIKGNMGMHQNAMCKAAIVLDNEDPEYGPTKAECGKWIMTGGGGTEYLLWNGFYRDGHGGESSPGYSSGWSINFYTVANLLPKLGVRIWDVPKMKKMADTGPDMAVAGITTPSIGDCGTIFGAGRVGWTAALQGPAFMHYKDPRHAAILKTIKAKSVRLFEDLFDEEAVAQAAEGVELEFKTRHLGGYGLAILESREKENPRGACMYYGFSGGGHGHRDRLTIQFMAYGKPILTDMGYPAHWLPKNTYWTSNTASHYGVVVDQVCQQTTNRAWLRTLADAGYVQLMDADASLVAYPKRTDRYRRTVALVDIDAERSYLLDIFRVRGGRQHDYSFHGPPFPEFSVSGATPGPVQKKGTVLGEDIPFAGIPSNCGSLNDGGYRLPLRQSPDVLLDPSISYAVRGQEAWASYHDGNEILTRKVGATMTLPIVEVPAGKCKILLRVYDYNSGENTLTLGLGETQVDLTYSPSGSKGYRWIDVVADLPAAASTFSMQAKRIGQPWCLVRNVVLSKDLGSSVPTVGDPRTSGFQYLFNVRRMKPKGAWSATWRDPQEDLALTTTVPAGVAEEVILADSEAELKPKHPDTLQYFLARNQSGKDDLTSIYISVSEAHRGAAKVQAVEKLKAIAKNPEAACAVSVRTSERTDLVHSSLRPEQQCRWQTEAGILEVRAEFASVSIDKDGVSRAAIVNGSSLKLGTFALSAPRQPTATVVAVDHQSNSITLDIALENPGLYIGRVAILGNELQQTSYKVVGATIEDGRTILSFGDVLCLVQMGLIDEYGEDSLKLSKLERVDGRQHTGRWLYNEDRSRGFRISNIKGAYFTIEANSADLKSIFTDSDRNGETRFWISDIGCGDSCRLPSIVTYKRE